MAQDGFGHRERGDAGAAKKRLDAAGRSQRQAQRASRAPAQRAAVDAADVSGCHMVSAMFKEDQLRQRAWDIAAGVVDPEIPVLTIADLGVLRDVAVSDGCVEVAITPTYSGCPAMNMITLEIELALERAGFRGSKVRTVLSPAWTTDWRSEEGRRRPSPGWVHGRKDRRGPPQAPRIRHRAAASRKLPPCVVRDRAGGVPA